MVNAEALAWARKIMGEPGPFVREALPGLLAATHSRYVALQQQSGLADASPYGLIWLGMPKALMDTFGNVARPYRPKRGRYHLPLVKGVPVIPWRYARDGKTDLKAVPFGQPVTDSRKSLFEPPTLPPELPFGEVGLADTILEELTVEQRQQVDSYSADIRALAANERLVAVLAFASNPEALLNAYFGYATLGSDALLKWSYCEELDLTSPGTGMLRDASMLSDRPTFHSGPLEEPKLRVRSPLENGPAGDNTPPPSPTGTHE
jgi:hypothetical protein